MIDTSIYNHHQELKDAFNRYKGIGLSPLPIPPKDGHPTKGPVLPEWQTKAANGEFTDRDFGDSGQLYGIGTLLGGDQHVTDIDLDMLLAVTIGNVILADKQTTMTFGHESKRRSHHVYATDKSLPSEKIYDPLEKEKKCVAEYRCVKDDGGRGHQTVFPPSLHYNEKTNETEFIDFEKDSAEEPIFVPSAILHRQFRLICATTLLAKYFPVESGRHDTMLALAGVFIRSDMKEQDAIRIVTLAYRHSTGFNNDEHNAAAAVKSVYLAACMPDRKSEGGVHLYGYPKLIELIDQKVVDRVLDLLDIARPKPELAEPTGIDTAPIFKMLRDQHLTKLPVVPFTYLIYPEIIQGFIHVVSGEPGGGKSTIVSMWCKQAAEANPNLTILYLDADNSQQGVNERMARVGPLPLNFFFWGNWTKDADGKYKPPPGIQSRELHAMVRDAGECIVVVDTLRGFFDGNENDNSDMAAFFQPMKRWAGYGATVIVLHHPDKQSSQPYCGASALKAAIDCGLFVKTIFNENKIVSMNVTAFKDRSGDDINIRYKMVNGAPVRETETIDDKLMSLLSKNPGVSMDGFEKIAASYNFRRDSVRDFVKTGKSNGTIEVKRGSMRVIDHAAIVAKRTEPEPTFDDVFDESEDELEGAGAA